jgi:hypothetical protein
MTAGPFGPVPPQEVVRPDRGPPRVLGRGALALPSCSVAGRRGPPLALGFSARLRRPPGPPEGRGPAPARTFPIH